MLNPFENIFLIRSVITRKFLLERKLMSLLKNRGGDFWRAKALDFSEGAQSVD